MIRMRTPSSPPPPEEPSSAELKRLASKTTLLDFAELCHIKLFARLAFLPLGSSVKGDPTNATGKVTPKQIRRWVGYDGEQEQIWKDLINTRLGKEKYFWSEDVIATKGETVETLPIGSEVDLDQRAGDCCQQPVQNVIQVMQQHSRLCNNYHVKGPLRFDNHRNAMSAEMDASHTGRADQYGLQMVKDAAGANFGLPVFVGESKIAQKLPLRMIRRGLKAIDLPEGSIPAGVRLPDQEEERARQVVPAVITQAYSYMIDTGVLYGYIFTGEAYIFLHIRDNDPSTVLYHLSVPDEDVDISTPPDSMQFRRSAVVQLLTFVLRSFKSPQRDQAWRAAVKESAYVWTEPEPLMSSPTTAPPSTNEKDETYVEERASDTSPRPRRKSRRLCRPPEETSHHPQSNDDDHDESEDEDGGDGKRDGRYSDSESPSVQTQRRRSMRADGRQSIPDASSLASMQHKAPESPQKFCTQRCLLGLVKGHDLDESCPNARIHGTGRHSISQATFLHLLDKQLRQSLDDDVINPHIHGSKAALLFLRLREYGYVVAAKCTSAQWFKENEREIAIYTHLQAIQGQHLPVYLGCVDLDPTRPYYYDGLARLTHFMILGYGSPCPLLHRDFNGEIDLRQRIMKQAQSSLSAIHNHGVLHNDIALRNIVWCRKESLVMFIDFEQAETFPYASKDSSDAILKSIDPPNTKTWQSHSYAKSGTKPNQEMEAPEANHPARKRTADRGISTEPSLVNKKRLTKSVDQRYRRRAQTLGAIAREMRELEDAWMLNCRS